MLASLRVWCYNPAVFSMNPLIQECLKESLAVKQRILEDASFLEKIQAVSDVLITAFSNGHKLLIAGNGGSAADAQHMAGEFVGKFFKDRHGMPAIALTVNSSVVTAWSNDVSYDDVFVRQIDALGQPGDVFIGISTSGNAESINRAFAKAKLQKIHTVALLGKDGGKAKGLADNELIVPSDSTPRIQEAHITLIHIICEIVEAACVQHFS